MSSIIIAFPVSRGKISLQIRDVLLSAGFDDVTIAATASDALQEMHLRKNGVLISCVQLPDMYYRDLMDYLPECFSLLLLDTGFNVGSLRESDVLALTLPVKARDLTDTVRMMDAAAEQKLRNMEHRRKKIRSEEDRQVISEAKEILMERNHMTEPESYRFIQKTSMDTGRTMLETAQMILMLKDHFDN